VDPQSLCIPRPVFGCRHINLRHRDLFFSQIPPRALSCYCTLISTPCIFFSPRHEVRQYASFPADIWIQNCAPPPPCDVVGHGTSSRRNWPCPTCDGCLSVRLRCFCGSSSQLFLQGGGGRAPFPHPSLFHTRLYTALLIPGKATDVYPSLLSAWFTHAFASETLCPLPPPPPSAFGISPGISNCR